MSEEHASMAASTLRACSHRSFALSTAPADRLKAISRPADISKRDAQASHWDPIDNCSFGMDRLPFARRPAVTVTRGAMQNASDLRWTMPHPLLPKHRL